MDVDKLCPTCLEIVNTALGIQTVSAGVSALSIFSSMMEEDTCLFFTFSWWSSYASLRHFNSVILSLISCQENVADRRLLHQPDYPDT